jgi:hypothetical protein
MPYCKPLQLLPESQRVCLAVLAAPCCTLARDACPTCMVSCAQTGLHPQQQLVGLWSHICSSHSHLRDAVAQQQNDWAPPDGGLRAACVGTRPGGCCC